jgi:RNase H-like domain found in reverse transcriptase
VPLYEVLEGTGWNRPNKKKEKIRIHDWDTRCGGRQRESLQRLRIVLADPSFLVPARANAKRRLCTDASRYGLGVALLLFDGEDKGWLPVLFSSRKMKGTEPRYTTTEKEF